MFSAEALRRAAEKWRAILARVPFARSIDLRIQAVENADEREALCILYASSPLSDWGNYDFSIFQSTAAHAVLLKKTSALPEEIFISYVLPARARRARNQLLVRRKHDLPLHRHAHDFRARCVSLGIRSLWGGIHTAGQRPACLRICRAPDLHAALDALRR